MTADQPPLESLLLHIHEQEEDGNIQQQAIRSLRQVKLTSQDVNRLMTCVEDKAHSTPVRIGAVQLLGYHRPWLDLDLLHDDQIHNIPARLVGLAGHSGEERALRDAIIGALGWQYLSEHGMWDILLADPDAFLRREALYELLRSPHRSAVETIIRHLDIETEPAVRSAALWGLCRHPLFFETALTILARPGGEQHINTVHAVCETDIPSATHALLNADMKFFDIKETLLRRLFQRLDRHRIACLVDMTHGSENRFAVRALREVEAEDACEILALLDRSVYLHHDDEWTNEAAKLALHYWERFIHLRENIRDLLNDWRRHSPKITQLAMEKSIYWRD